MPRALPGRDDYVLRRGKGPHFVLTRWKFQHNDTLVARLDVMVRATDEGTAADVRVSPVRAAAVMLFFPLLPLFALPVPELVPGSHFRLFLLGMAVVLAAVFWGIAWSNVPEYDEDRREMLNLVQSILDGEPLETSRTDKTGWLARIGLDDGISPSDVVMVLLLLAQPATVIAVVLKPDLLPWPRLTLAAIFLPIDIGVLWWITRSAPDDAERAESGPE
jgi:hypothetical protein